MDAAPQAQVLNNISRSISLFQSVRSPKKTQGIDQGGSEFTGVFDKYSHIATAKIFGTLPVTERSRSVRIALATAITKNSSLKYTNTS